jgi:hypothetical protein
MDATPDLSYQDVQYLACACPWRRPRVYLLAPPSMCIQVFPVAHTLAAVPMGSTYVLMVQTGPQLSLPVTPQGLQLEVGTLGPLEGTDSELRVGFTALPWAPLEWRQLHWQTYQDVFSSC